MAYPCSNFSRSSASPWVTSAALSAARPRSGLVVFLVAEERPTRLPLLSSQYSVLNLQAGAGSFSGLCNVTRYSAAGAFAPRNMWGGILVSDLAGNADLYNRGTPGRTPRARRV